MRRVHYDPFGMRVQGMQQGMQNEMQMQDQTRRARAADFDFEEMAPLRLNEAQRNDFLGNASVPYQLNSLDINQDIARNNLYGQNLGLATEFGLATGQTDPMGQLYQGRYGEFPFDGEEALKFHDRDFTLQSMLQMLAAEAQRANIDRMPWDMQNSENHAYVNWLHSQNRANRNNLDWQRYMQPRGRGQPQSPQNLGVPVGAPQDTPPMMQPPQSGQTQFNISDAMRRRLGGG